MKTPPAVVWQLSASDNNLGFCVTPTHVKDGRLGCRRLQRQPGEHDWWISQGQWIPRPVLMSVVWVGASDFCGRLFSGSISHSRWDMLFTSLCSFARMCPRLACREVFPVSAWCGVCNVLWTQEHCRLMQKLGHDPHSSQALSEVLAWPQAPDGTCWGWPSSLPFTSAITETNSKPPNTHPVPSSKIILVTWLIVKALCWLVLYLTSPDFAEKTAIAMSVSPVWEQGLWKTLRCSSEIVTRTIDRCPTRR